MKLIVLLHLMYTYTGNLCSESLIKLSYVETEVLFYYFLHRSNSCIRCVCTKLSQSRYKYVMPAINRPTS